MLKSTHRAVVSVPSASPLPPGWTEHRAPTGHSYFYNAETKQSTYVRPTVTPESEELLIDYGATEPDRQVQASLNIMQEFHKNNDPSQTRPGQFTGGRSYQDRARNRDDSRPNRQGDKPKTKTAIPNGAPWILVKTKYGRRFVHNTETKESFWKFPSDVMMNVIEMDRIEWEKKQPAVKATEGTTPAVTPATAKQETAVDKLPHAETQTIEGGYDSDEYEEVEVTDDETDGQDTKRPRLENEQSANTADQAPAGPSEFNEDDIAWQLAQMEADEADPGYDYDLDDQDPDEAGGIPLTSEDKEALYRSLLDEFDISPFSTFDSLIDTNTSVANAVISDNRWTALPNMSARRAAFDIWSRDRVAERNSDGLSSQLPNSSDAPQRKPEKIDPRLAYLRFLSREASVKLYWPEFKRKFKKSPEMADRYFADKDREKLYREYVAKLKLSDADRKKDLIALLKSVPADAWKTDSLPEKVEKDIRFYGLRDESSRAELVDGYTSTMRR